MARPQKATPAHDSVLGNGEGFSRPAQAKQAGDVVVMDEECSATVRTIVTLAPGSDYLVHSCRLREAVAIEVGNGQALTHVHDLARVFAFSLDKNSKRLFLQFLCGAEVAILSLHARDIPKQGRHLRRMLALLSPLDRERFFIHRKRLVVSTCFIACIGERFQHLR